MSTTDRWQAMRPTDIGVPGPTPRDMARAFRSVRHDPLSFLGRVTRQYGDTVAFPVPGTPALLLNDPADVRHVLQTASRNWGKQTVQYAALARVTGPGLLASSERSWIEHRRLAAPAFHHHRLEVVGEQVTAAVDAVLADGPGRLAPGTAAVVDVAPLLHRVALDAVGRALFAADLSGRAQQLLTASSRAAELVVRLGRSVLPTASWAPTPTNVRLRSTRARLDAACAELVDERRRSGRTATGTHGDDLLGLLLDSGLTDGEIRDELVTMVIAGHETVAAALTWTLMLLAQHPHTQESVRDELEAHAGAVSMLSGRGDLPLTRAVVDEALRLYPPAWALSRRAASADVVAGREVPAGTLAVISPWILHRRPDTWPDPTAFRPERFLGAAGGRPDGYLPFGLGPRLCIGREFALGEMVVVLSRLLPAFHVGLPSGWAQPEAQALVAVHPRGGMPLLLRRRPGAT